MISAFKKGWRDEKLRVAEEKRQAEERQQTEDAQKMSRSPGEGMAATCASNNGKGAQSEAPGSRTLFATLSLHTSDRIRLLDFPLEARAAVQSCIERTWPSGIQLIREYGGSWEFKLRGTPWVPSGEDAIHARRLVREIFAALYAAGWVLYISTDLSRQQTDKDTLLFRHQDPPPAPSEWFAMSFSKTDRVRIVEAPPHVANKLAQALQSWTQARRPYLGADEVKLLGAPFMASGSETMEARKVVIALAGALEQCGFSIYASIDQKSGGSHGEETDTWYLRRMVGWTPGPPVYHG